MSVEDGCISSCSLAAAISVKKLVSSSLLFRFVSCFGEVSLPGPLLSLLMAFLFFLASDLPTVKCFHLENPPFHGAQQNTSISYGRSTQGSDRH